MSYARAPEAHKSVGTLTLCILPASHFDLTPAAPPCFLLLAHCCVSLGRTGTRQGLLLPATPSTVSRLAHHLRYLASQRRQGLRGLSDAARNVLCWFHRDDIAVPLALGIRVAKFPFDQIVDPVLLAVRKHLRRVRTNRRE